MSTPTTPPLPETPTPPTITYYQQLADQVFAELDAIANAFPRVEARRIWTVDFFRSHLNVPTDFLATVIAAVEQIPELQAVRRLDVDAARDTLQFLEAFRPVLDRINAMARTLQYTMSSRKASLAADSLQIYAIAKGIARSQDSAEVASLVASMKRDLGHRGRPKATTLARKAAAALRGEAE